VVVKGGLHAMSHCLLNLAPLRLGGDAQCELDTECVSAEEEQPRPPRALVTDARPGGLGLCKKVRLSGGQRVVCRPVGRSAGRPRELADGAGSCLRTYRACC
jgi:hypothetical protein